MSKHTPEPWRDESYNPTTADDSTIMSGETNVVSGCGCCGSPRIKPEDRARIVACVNACAGMDDPAEIIAGLHIARDALAVVAAQRDELATALREIANSKHCNPSASMLIAEARSVLAKIGK